MNNIRLNGRCVLVTGAGGGLGRATALRLAAEGALVLLTDTDEQALAATEAYVRKQGGDPATRTGDLLKPDFAASLAGHAETVFGRLDGLCNVAGISPAIPFEQTTAEDFDRIMGVNCKAQLLLIQAALPLLRRPRSAAASHCPTWWPTEHPRRPSSGSPGASPTSSPGKASGATRYAQAASPRRWRRACWRPSPTARRR